MSEKLRKQTLDDISKTNWLDGVTKSILYDKIQMVHMMIGYYDWYDEPQGVESYYAEVISIFLCQNNCYIIKN